MKQKHIEKEEYISRLARDKEEMKVLNLLTLTLLAIYDACNTNHVYA